ncbi:unnamed protein product [Polarella glacialis]|uniref:very-long-chain (3R)-3-hydroxyacyl-CoA dehydratase n=1 Tax=Polarella glacialis TaxID=89957 RepID=A0A813DFS0_POLGL|nr:unnamed protein product [Polarella glacialis]
MADSGVDFPLDQDGKRSTTGLNQGAFAAAVKSHKEAHEAVVAEKKWRFGYVKHVVRQTQLAAKSEEAALGIANAGLDYMHSTMEFCRDGASMPLKEAMAKYRENAFESFTVKGSQESGQSELEVPYGGRTLKGEELKAQAEIWVRRGVIELDTGAALMRVADSPGWLDLSDHTFVLFGAGSAMGPFPILMAHGAHVVAIDLARPQIWKRLLATARASPGRLTVPVKAPAPTDASDDQIAELAGCDLLAQTPEVRNWLMKLPLDSRLVLGGYCYADGPLFVRVSMAMDAIIADLVKEMKVKPAVAYLCTPTDALVCTSTSAAAAAENLRKSMWWQPIVGKLLGFAKMGLSGNRVKGEDGDLPIVDALVKEQGPNYCLAKRLQHWRAIVSRNDGCVVSTNVAPATATVSVVSNKSFALAYKGMHYFKPMEIFQAETSNAVMSALLVNDLRNPGSAANPSTPLKNPMQLFAATSFHGGAYRCGYKFGTIGPAAAIAYLFNAYVVKGYLALYSAAQMMGWSMGLFIFATQGATAAENVISTVTYMQLLEVAHAAIGMVPSNPVLTLMQIASRVMMVQNLACSTSVESRAGMAPWQILMFFAWSVTEVVRYCYYTLNTLGVQIPPLTWLRYSTFLILYPLGISGELGMTFYALPEMTLRAATTTSGCDLAGACGKLAAIVQRVGFPALLGVYALCFPMLFGTMLSQRRKVLGKAKDKTKKKD